MGLPTHVIGPDAIPHYDPSAPFDSLEPEIAAGIERASALAEVLPEHKHAAVATLRKRGWTVGMMAGPIVYYSHHHIFPRLHSSVFFFYVFFFFGRSTPPKKKHVFTSFEAASSRANACVNANSHGHRCE